MLLYLLCLAIGVILGVVVTIACLGERRGVPVAPVADSPAVAATEAASQEETPAAPKVVYGYCPKARGPVRKV